MRNTVLVIDNFDSFTHMLADYLMQCGVDCLFKRNHEPDLLSLDYSKFLAVIISPGPETPEKAGLLMEAIPLFVHKVPVLGICLGHQAIGLNFGSKLVKAKLPRHGKVDWVNHLGDEIFESINSPFQATRYHSLILEDIAENLVAICSCENEIMGIKLRGFPVWGLQFHPESCRTSEGFTMIKNFVTLAKRIAQN